MCQNLISSDNIDLNGTCVTTCDPNSWDLSVGQWQKSKIMMNGNFKACFQRIDLIFELAAQTLPCLH